MPIDRQKLKQLSQQVQKELDEAESDTDTVDQSSVGTGTETSSSTDGRKKRRNDDHSKPLPKKEPKLMTFEQLDASEMRVGSNEWMIQFQEMTFPPADYIYEMNGQLLAEYDKNYPWARPIRIKKEGSEGLGIKIPKIKTIEDITRHFDSKFKVEVIDVHSQETKKMLLKEFVNSWNKRNRDCTLNLLSLEFTGMKLADHVLSPKFVRDISWFEATIPNDGYGLPPPEARVNYYAILSMKNSFTNWHVDFGGTSVWYHVLKGKKNFLLLRPTDENLELFQAWEQNADKSKIFFGKKATCIQVEAGETILLPSGYIHAVHTLEDSFAFGGNFLHHQCVPMQIKIFEMEKQLKIGRKYRMPDFIPWQMVGIRLILEKFKGGNSITILDIDAADALIKFFLKDKTSKGVQMNLLQEFTILTKGICFDMAIVPEDWNLTAGKGLFQPKEDELYAVEDEEGEGKIFLAKKCHLKDCTQCLKPPKDLKGRPKHVLLCVDIVSRNVLLPTKWAVAESAKWFEIEKE